MMNIDEENVHVFRTTLRISMKFSGKMCLMIILKVTKNQDFATSLENALLEKPQGVLGGGGFKLTPQPF